MIKKLLNNLVKRREGERRVELYRKFIHHEAQIGGKLFGHVPEGHRREFFCLDRYTWIWHEEWADQQGIKTVTTEYKVRPSGVVKIQYGRAIPLNLEEAKRLYQAIKLYKERVNRELYHTLV